jgi:hypothetical protein
VLRVPDAAAREALEAWRPDRAVRHVRRRGMHAPLARVVEHGRGVPEARTAAQGRQGAVAVILVGVIGLAIVFLLRGHDRDDDPPPPAPSCATCGARFTDQRGVQWHREAAHPEVFEEPARPAEYRNTEGRA